ncbi:hypothetical protein CAV_1544 [Campylobacter avium LMG 24591]|uniref:Uncharacterized protein n=1 Tax=Campylobacter avium LMG 24591 TaxID=522484 RepID=A0A222MZM2_9BACT|nr:hypothetical protein [Campylobacter avium]ASQ31150.1 hypothetical protein CAV_1544 [Campylobacter avium LMG 24591]OYD78534.1 hypothetical protein CAV8706_1541 [Campylobacter avium]
MQIFELVLNLHIYSIYTVAFLMLFYLYLTQSNFSTEFNFIKRIRLFLPIYYMFLAIVFFTGILMLALLNFELNHYRIFMIVSWCLILFLNILQYKSFKKARMYRRYKTYRTFSFFILLFNLILVVLPFLHKYDFI